MANCIKCKQPLPEGAAFCPACGKRQSPAPARKALKRANGSGSVFKKNDARRKKPWAATKNKVLIGYFSTKTEALEALDKAQPVELGERYNATFDQVFGLWKEEHYRELSAKGIEQYENAYKRCTDLGPLKFRNIRLNQMQAIIDDMAGQGLSQSSCNKVKQLLGQMSKWAIREDIILKNQAQFIKLPEEAKKEKEIFSDADLRKLWAASGSDQTVQVILVLIYTGMRIGELFTMERDNVHPLEGYMVGGNKTKAGKGRIIPIKPVISPFIDSLYAQSEPGGLLISGYDGQRDLSNFRTREYYPTLDRLGIKRRNPHCTRHTFASLAVRAGVRPEVLQKLLGHASYSTTADIYVHADVDELRAAVSSI